MFHVRSVSEYNFNEPIDQQSVVIANIMRTKDNTAQLIIGTLRGNVYIMQFTKQFSQQDIIAEVQTEQPILGILVGSFSQPYVILPSEPQEKLEIAVIHPRQVQIYSPVRNKETGIIQLQQLYTIDLDGHHIASFTVCNRRNMMLDQNKNKRLSIHSWIAIKSMTGILMVIQGQKIVQKVTMSHQYALPTPITFNPLSDQLIIATFEYDVIGIQMQKILQMQAENTSEQQSEKDQNGAQGLVPVFNVGLNSRIQQLECGRFFMGDSSPQGEVAVVSQDVILFIDSDGHLVKEVKTGDRIVWIYPVQWQGDSRALGKYPQIISTLVLLETDEVLIIQAGLIKWRGLPAQGDITALEIQMGNFEVLSDAQHVSISENSSHIELKQFAGSCVDLGNNSNHSIKSDKQDNEFKQDQNMQNQITIEDQNDNEIKREIVNDLGSSSANNIADQITTEDTNKLSTLKNNTNVQFKSNINRGPLRATAELRNDLINAQLGQLSDINHLLLVQGPICLGAQFMGHIMAPSIFPQRPGLFILASSKADIRVCFFGTTVDQVGNLLPEKLPSAETSRQLRERLQSQLEQLRATRESHDFAEGNINLQCTFTGIQFSGNQIITNGQLSFKQSQYDEIVDLTMIVLSFNDNFQIENKNFKVGLTTQNFKMAVNQGQFLCMQRISCSVHFKTYNEAGDLIPGQYNVMVRVPLLSFCTIDAVELSKAKEFKFKFALHLQTPSMSIQQFVRKNCGPIGEAAAQKLDEKNQNGDEHCLALCQANGAIVCMNVEDNNVIQLYGPGYEVFFMAVEFLSQGNEAFSIDCNKQEFTTYILQCYKIQKSMDAQEKEMEDELIRRIEEFNVVNQKMNTEFLAQQSPILDFKDDPMYTNIAEHLGVLQIYIEQIMKRLERFGIEKQNCIEKIKAMLLFAIQIKSKCDAGEVDRLSAQFLECELDNLDKAIKQHIGGSNIEHLINHLLS